VPSPPEEEEAGEEEKGEPPVGRSSEYEVGAEVEYVQL